jgi:formiminotetrahydrofolate cyclodeaminase
MIDQTFRQLIDSIAAKTPTPGGGAAAALSACIGTALFVMVVRFSRGKKANVEREADLARVEATLTDQLQRLLPMAERDCRSFDQVSAAYAMPKATEAERQLRDKAIQEAMLGAMVVPEETLCLVRDVFQAMHDVVGCISKAIVSDLAAGAAVLLAAAEGGYLNVRINAAYLVDRELAGQRSERAKAVRQEARKHQEAIAATVDRMLA